MQIDWEPLVQAAHKVREHAYAPFSKFRVGAALLTADGRIFTGCNIENRTYGLTLCAERCAIAAWVAAGSPGHPQALVVHADLSPPARPCGLCRETLAEFTKDLPILLTNPKGERDLVTLKEIFPQPFEWTGPAHGR